MDVQELLDREAIRCTLTKYTFATDRGRVEDLVACFTADGVLDFEGEWRGCGQHEVRARIVAAAELTARRSPGRTLLRHHLSTQHVELVSRDEARAWSYFMAVTDAGPDHVGRYVDRLRHVAGSWLIAHRRVSVEWWSPGTIYVEQAARARERCR
jgi:hypothetical protein